MRDRLMLDVLECEGIEWIALIGPDALPISCAPENPDAEAIAAIWFGLDQLSNEMPAKMMIRTTDAILLSNRVDENRILLVVASHAANVGLARTILKDAASRMLDLR
ncbi:MAG: hypothetical protein CMJ72_00295 [Planctomycetaceae bacterium]|nr:hypothetical protein [Planctomycetaceae bacterium]|tara:strand:- start:509 stop:829 length:321 start_codon:yes stop_codon:yes gene_type:complete